MLLIVKQCPCKKPISHVLDNHSDVVANLQNSVCNSCTPTCRCLPSMLQCGRRRWKDSWLFVCVCLCGIQNGPLHIFNTTFQDSFTLLWLIWSLKTRENKASVSHWLQICEALTLCCTKVTFHSEFTSIFLFKPNCYLIVLCDCDVLVALLCCPWICWDIFPPPAYPPDSHP